MAQSKALTATGQICKALDQMEGSLNESLAGTGVSVGRFLATAKTAVQTHGDKKRLENADRNSLYLAIKSAASDGLMPDGREAALVVYGSVVQYQPMVMGLVKLARKSGEIESLGAYIVYDKDDFSYKAGVDPVPEHDADWFGERGEPIGVWAFVKLKTGDYLDPVMLTKERIDRIATRSKIAGNYNPKTGKDWEEWWKKAAIRNILKYAPKSTALEGAMRDSDKEFSFDDDGVVHDDPAPVNPVSEKPKTETKAAAAVKGKTKAKAKEEEPAAPEGEQEPIDAEFTPVEEAEEEIPV